MQNTANKAIHLIVVDSDDLLPEAVHLTQLKVFAEINQVQDVLAKARSAKPHAGIEEFWADA